MPDLRCVVDTNVLISALLFEQSKPGQAVFRVLEHGKLLLSFPVLREIDEVLRRPKFDAYVLPEERERFLVDLVREAVLVEVSETVRACRDPRDDKFLDLALAGTASYLISGDPDLLALHPFREIPILTPGEVRARELMRGSRPTGRSAAP
jgi:uncharacterized protein